MRRLVALALVALAGCGGAESPTAGDEVLDPVRLVEALREGGYVIYLRHAATDRSQEDAGFLDLEDCSTQRNLNEAGREQAREIGRGFRALEIPLGDVLSSEYCRTRETAELAFERLEPEPDLTGFPNAGEPGFTESVRDTKAAARAASRRRLEHTPRRPHQEPRGVGRNLDRGG